MRVDGLSKGPGALALRRLRRDREAVAFGVLLALVILALFGAPLYASRVAGTTPEENHLTDAVTIDGERENVVSLDGVPLGPTWGRACFLGADENGRDLMVRILYGARTSLLIGAGALISRLSTWSGRFRHYSLASCSPRRSASRVRRSDPLNWGPDRS